VSREASEAGGYDDGETEAARLREIATQAEVAPIDDALDEFEPTFAPDAVIAMAPWMMHAPLAQEWIAT
jgi:hypothetical protein